MSYLWIEKYFKNISFLFCYIVVVTNISETLKMNFNAVRSRGPETKRVR